MRPYDMFCNNHKIGSISAPILIVHGDEDTIVPYAHGEKLYNMAKNKFRFVTVDGADHNNIFRYLDAYTYNSHIEDLIEESKK